MVYDYVIVDSKLLAYESFHGRRPIETLFFRVATLLKINEIQFKRLLWAADWNKSEYRLALQPDYKGHRSSVDKSKSTEEQIRKENFFKNYTKLHKLFEDIGFNLQKSTSRTEADDMRLLVRELAPSANILLVSLDEDWYTDIYDSDGNHGATHLLKYTKNTVFTSQAQVKELYGLAGQDLIDYNAICGQTKDNIHGIKNFGKKRFIKHLMCEPKDNWFNVLDDLLAKGKYGMRLPSAAKYRTPLEQYHHNLLLMNPMPVSEHTATDVAYAKEALTREPTDVAYVDFVRKCIEEIGGYPTISKQDYHMLKYGNV